ncbi:MAG: SPOR domain-containing protein [Bacteroidetes bacterium]|nr:SPOR domain-containing protein [Bacteroidota bacterium]MBL6943151.1 SPOR domain-containing protein [Bacteroidales bacterium]
MKRIAGLIFLIAFIVGSLFSQNTDESRVIVIGDTRIDNLVQLHIEHNKKYPEFQGYRIQIHMASGNDALVITEEVKSGFSKKYPDIPAYLTFGEPNYRVRVGDFRTRLEAEKFLEKISRKYPGAWVTQDYINPPDLQKFKNTNSYE